VLLRIGVNLGDIVAHPEGDLYGDGVNVAVRLEGIADPGGIVISAKVHDELQGKLALSFEDRGEQQVKNIARPVRVYALTGAAPSRSEPKALPLPDKPSIAVLPFANMSGDPDQGHVADGVVEEIIAALSRVRSFFVISRNSTFTYKGRSVDPRQVSRELGVRYVVEGSVRKSGRRLRIVAQLIDATTGNHVWGERYEGDASDIFDLQDRVTEAVVGALEPSITVNEIARARSKRPESLTAYDLVMRALPAIWSQDSETTQGGLRLAEQAIELDPSYALPRAVAAWCYAQRLSYLRTKNLSEDRAKAVTLAQEAARIDDNDPLVLTCAGAAYSIAREYPRAQALIQKALALDPNSAWAWHRSGWLHAYIREPDTAIQHFERAMRLSPLDPLTFNVFIGIGAAHFEKKEYDAAAGWIEKGLREKPDALWAYRLLSASYFYARRTDEARRTFAAFAETFPGLTVSSLLDPTPWSDSIKAKFGEAFRALGLPE
jgi:adenylate cyclase